MAAAAEPRDRGPARKLPVGERTAAARAKRDHGGLGGGTAEAPTTPGAAMAEARALGKGKCPTPGARGARARRALLPTNACGHPAIAAVRSAASCALPCYG